MYNPNLRFHFTGIAGSGMSGIAEVLINLGFRVSGSDLKYSEVCKRLEQQGAVIFTGHAAEHVPENASLLVYSSAVPPDNPELQEARSRGIPVVRRAEVLAELMRLKFSVGVAGSHGKTTTTSMIGTVLEGGGLDPTIVIGGQVKGTGSGGRLGKGDYFVAETDESDRSFLLLRPTIAVVTNIDSEHLGAYESFDELVSSFQDFVESVPFYGLAIMCIDDPELKKIYSALRTRKVSYGFSADADIRAENITQVKTRTSFDVIADDKVLGRIDLPMPGRHLVLNSLAAVAAGLEFGIGVDVIQRSLSDFSGVKRRLEVIGERSGITVMNDYGHHPTEIVATLRAIREGWGSHLKQLHVVFQPHRYTRTRDCYEGFLDAFGDAHNLFLTDIYAASEQPLPGVSGEKLAQDVRAAKTEFYPTLEQVLPNLRTVAGAGDVVLFLGAGSVGKFADTFYEMLGDVE